MFLRSQIEVKVIQLYEINPIYEKSMQLIIENMDK